MSEKYDRHEAELLLARATFRSPMHEAARQVAKAELVAAIKGLHGYCGLHVVEDDEGNGGLEIQLGPRLLWISYSPSEKGFVYRGAGSHAPIRLPIAFNPALGIFEGEKYDDDIIPVPGLPRARKDALAVIVRYVLDEPAR